MSDIKEEVVSDTEQDRKYHKEHKKDKRREKDKKKKKKKDKERKLKRVKVREIADDDYVMEIMDRCTPTPSVERVPKHRSAVQSYSSSVVFVKQEIKEEPEDIEYESVEGTFFFKFFLSFC